MDLRTVWTTMELAHHAGCSERTIRRWLRAEHPAITDADVTFARQLPGTGGWFINSQHPAVVTFLAAPRTKGRPAIKPTSTKEAFT